MVCHGTRSYDGRGAGASGVRDGIAETEADRTNIERQHRRRIDRSFTFPRKEVTVEQFQRFLAENPQ